MVKKVVTRADLKEFAEEIRQQTGFNPPNWDEIVEVAIKKYKEKQKED